MYLFINFKNSYPDEFVDYLIIQLQKRFLKTLEVNKLKELEDYLNSVPKYKSIFIKYLKAKDICIAGIYNISADRTKTNLRLYINPNVKYYGTNIKLVDLCKFINNGNLQCPGYPIFSESFNYIKNNIEKYYLKYLFENKHKR